MTSAHPLARLAVARIQARTAEARAAAVARTIRAAAPPQDILAWASSKYYIPETGLPIDLAPFQAAVLRYAMQRTTDGYLRWRTVVWSQVKKAGKALALNTPLPTPEGWTTMGDVKVGDTVFDEGGAPCRVTFATDVMVGHPCYLVRFSDDAEIVADAEHQWAVECLMNFGASYQSYVLTTEQLSWGITARNDGARRYRVPVAGALRLPEAELPVAPYVLGAWLGDGTTAGANITGIDQGIFDRIAETDSVRAVKVKDRTPSYRIAGNKRGETALLERSETMSSRLRVLGLLGNKHIPAIYLRASYDQRLALLQGLMDTDGYISAPKGTSGSRCEFAVVSERLALDTRELLTSLGIQSRLQVNAARLYGRDCGLRYRVSFSATSALPVFSLSRKLERQRPATDRTLRSTNRHIVAVEPVESVPVRCIQVDSPSHLYLAGESMIPTHNTAISGAVGRYAAETWGQYQEVLYVGNDADQAKERGFAAAKQSIELTSGYNRARRELSGKWRTLDATMYNLENGSTIKAVATDYTGEAGANPSITIWTELWGFIHPAALRFWAEMAPSPTRQNSMRWVETYAGYEGESELLWGLYESTVKNGRQLRVRDLEAMFSPEELDVMLAEGPLFAECPDLDDLVPCYVNDTAGTFAFWDDGVKARRMPWQQGERGAAYYANEAATQTPSQMQRLHENLWVSATSSFVDIALWDACQQAPLPLIAGDKTPLVVGLDAATTKDCFGLVVVSRDPANPKDVAVRMVKKWTPSPGNPIVFSDPGGPTEIIKWLAANFNVTEFAYDPAQLQQIALDLAKERVGWFREFPQGAARLEADNGLYDLIVHRRIRHDGNLDLREHCTNANAKTGAAEDRQLRIVKKSENRKIDLLVALSMSAAECLRLNI